MTGRTRHNRVQSLVFLGDLRQADGKPVSRKEIAQTYLSDPNAVHYVEFSGPFWALARNFSSGAGLFLQDEAQGCSAKLGLNFRLDQIVFFLMLPLPARVNGLGFLNNGRLEAEYLTEIEKELQH